METNKEKNFDEKAFVKEAYQALIDRGVITGDMLMPSMVTDEMLDAFEQEFDIKLPSLLRVYLQTYCHNIDGLTAPVPDDIYDLDEDTMRQIRDMSIEDVNELSQDELPYVEPYLCVMFPIPPDNPLGAFREALKGFREVVYCLDKEDELTEDDVKQFIPFADWMSAGPLCIDTSICEEDIRCEDDDTWQVCWFDHEEFHWKQKGVEYINDEGVVVGDKMLADFKCFLRLYFYGIYDRNYEMQLEEDGEEMPDKSEWCSVG